MQITLSGSYMLICTRKILVAPWNYSCRLRGRSRILILASHHWFLRASVPTYFKIVTLFKLKVISKYSSEKWPKSKGCNEALKVVGTILYSKPNSVNVQVEQNLGGKLNGLIAIPSRSLEYSYHIGIPYRYVYGFFSGRTLSPKTCNTASYGYFMNVFHIFHIKT